MGKFAAFMDKVMADEAAKAEFGAVIGARKERELSDDDFQKIGELSEKLGAAVTLDEVKDFFTGNGRELSEEELAGVAGGAGKLYLTDSKTFLCPLCGEEIHTIRVCFIRGEATNADSEKEHVRVILADHLLDKHGAVVWNSLWDAKNKAEEMINQSWWEEFIRNGENATRS